MKKGKVFRWVSTGTILAGGFGWLLIQQLLGGSSGCGGLTSQLSTGSASVLAHAPTVSVPTIAWALQTRHSPLSADDAAYIYQQSQAYSIDDAFALALWAEETQDGATAFPGSYNIGNVTGSPGMTVTGDDGITRTFRVYTSWQEAIAAWFSMVETLYIRGGHASDLGTFALYYVHGLLPDAPGAADVLAAMEAAPDPQAGTAGGYVWQVEQIIGDLATHEQQVRASGSQNTSGGSGNAGAQMSLASLLPTSVSHAWASEDALTAAASLSVQSCAASTSNLGTLTQREGMTSLLQKLFVFSGHLVSDGAFFDTWDGQAPIGVRSQAGVVWCTDFIASLYQVVTGKAFPAFPDANQWMGTIGQEAGFQAFTPSPGVYPQPGNMVVLDTGYPGGHVALVVGVQPPAGDQPGFVLVLQGHATSVLERWPLFPDGTVRPPWVGSGNRTLGYIQVSAFALHPATSKVQPLLQADANAGYDSPAQYTAYWNAACSAADLTMVLRAWGVSVTIGQVIDDLANHQPPYLTPTGGLMDQGGFDYVAERYGLEARVHLDGTLTLTGILNLTAQGIPVIVGLRDDAGAYYPAFAGGGHFLIIVGGDETLLHIVDSSLYRITALSQAVFTALWTGEAVVITPA
jgi:hypothetical protein